MNRLKANYHTHTTRCHHADGLEQEYVEAALCEGYQVLGFSDHSPWPFSSGFVSRMRMLPEELDGYCGTVRRLREEYSGRIRLHLGLEAEYFPRYTDYLHFLREEKLDYLILGQHFLTSFVRKSWTI